MTRSPDPANAAKLNDFLCFAVYSANLAFGRAYRPILDEVGLTYTQYVALVALKRVGVATNQISLFHFGWTNKIKKMLLNQPCLIFS